MHIWIQKSIAQKRATSLTWYHSANDFPPQISVQFVEALIPRKTNWDFIEIITGLEPILWEMEVIEEVEIVNSEDYHANNENQQNQNIKNMANEGSSMDDLHSW